MGLFIYLFKKKKHICNTFCNIFAIFFKGGILTNKKKEKKGKS
jgi:hypothetical protein